MLSDRVFCASVILVAILSSIFFFYYDESSTSGSSGISAYLPQLRCLNVNSWIGGLAHKLCFGVIFACVIHAVLLSVFEYRALLANVNAIRLRLKYDSFET